VNECTADGTIPIFILFWFFFLPAGVEGGEEEREDEELLPECTALPCFCTLIYLAFRLWRCFSFFLASQLEVAHLAGSAIRIRIFPRSFNSCGRVAGREEGFW